MQKWKLALIILPVFIPVLTPFEVNYKWSRYISCKLLFTFSPPACSTSWSFDSLCSAILDTSVMLLLSNNSDQPFVWRDKADYRLVKKALVLRHDTSVTSQRTSHRQSTLNYSWVVSNQRRTACFTNDSIVSRYKWRRISHRFSDVQSERLIGSRLVGKGQIDNGSAFELNLHRHSCACLCSERGASGQRHASITVMIKALRPQIYLGKSPVQTTERYATILKKSCCSAMLNWLNLYKGVSVLVN